METVARTKIVATVGPASWDVPKLAELIRTGVDVFRINTAHGDQESRQEVLKRIRAASAEVGRAVSVLVDLAGPKIRLNDLASDPVSVTKGQSIRFEESERLLTDQVLGCKFPGIIDGLEPGDSILIADGLIKLEVKEKAGGAVVCDVMNGGVLRGRQGVNVPGAKLNVSALSQRDREIAVWAAEQKVEWISLSFVRSANEVRELKEIVSGIGNGSQVVAKIEKPEALEMLEQIVEATDAVMVARGDLGVEIELEKTPAAQKRVIQTCREFGRPVIVATQMLESMHHQPRPTRAEVSDVANAIWDGADACMLSGETAVGEFPQKAAEVMNRIMLESESQWRHLPSESIRPLGTDVSLSLARAAASVATELDAKLILMLSDRVDFARSLSRLRVPIPTIAFTSKDEVAGALNLYWGIVPEKISEQESHCEDFLKQTLIDPRSGDWGLADGDRVVMVKDSIVSSGDGAWLTVVTYQA